MPGEYGIRPEQPPKKFVIAGIGDAKKEHSRDAALARLNEKSKTGEAPKGWKKWFSKVRSVVVDQIWKQNLARPYYETKYQKQEEKKIEKSGSLYIGEKEFDLNEKGISEEEKQRRLAKAKAAQEESNKSLTHRIADAEGTSAEGLLREGEKRETLGNSQAEREIKAGMQGLVKAYARELISDSELEAHQTAIFARIQGVKPEVLKKGEMYASNLLEIARWAKKKVAEEVALQVDQRAAQDAAIQNLNLDFDVVVAKAKTGLQTEAQFSSVERVVESIQKHTKGIFNETAVTAAVAGAYILGKRIITSGVVRAASYFGAGVLGTGALAYKREAVRQEQERAEHARAKLQNRKYDEATSGRRNELEKSRIQFRQANDLEADVKSALFSRLQDREVKDLTAEEYQEALKAVVEIDSRKLEGQRGIVTRKKQSWKFWKSKDQRFSETRHKADLIGYSDVTKVIQEQDKLDRISVEAKQKLLEWAIAHGQTKEQFKAVLNAANETNIATFYEGDKGITNQNERFAVYKHKKAKTSAKWAMIIGGSVGLAIQEGMAFHDDQTYGALEHIGDKMLGHQHVYTPHFKDGHPVPEKNTLLEALYEREQRFLELPTVHAAGPPVTEIIGSHHYEMNGDLHFEQPAGDPTHYYLTDASGNHVSKLLEADSSGNLTPDSRTWLTDHGYHLTETTGGGGSSGIVGLNEAETMAKYPGLSHHEIIDQHDEPGKFWSEVHHKMIEYEGKQQMAYLEKIDGHVYLNIHKLYDNFLEEVRERVNSPDFGQVKGYLNADGSPFVDPKMLELKGQILDQINDGTLRDHFQAFVYPTEGALHAHVSDLMQGADEHFRILLEGGDAHENWSPLWDNDPKHLFDGHLPVRVIGAGYDNHMLGAARGLAENSEVPTTHIIPPGFEGPPIIPPGGQEFPPVVVPPIFYAGRRKGLEETRGRRRIGPTEYPYYGSQSPDEILEDFKRRGIERDPYLIVKRDGKRTLVDINGQEIKRDAGRERKRIADYLDSQSSDFRANLERLNQTLPPMSENCRVAICVPARFEAPHLDNFLEQMSKQTDGAKNPLSLDMFEINVIVNKKDSETADNSVEVINKWKQSHPQVHVNVINLSFPDDEACVGLARKYITDLSMLRSVKRTSQAGPLYIESHDADLFGVDRRLVWKLTNDYDNHPELDVLRGVQDRRPEIMQQNDMLFFRTRLWDFMENVLRNPKYRPDVNPNYDFRWHRVTSGGTNSAVTAEAYCQIGGYNGTLKMGEDIDIGSKILMLRAFEDRPGHVVPNTWTSKASGIRDSTSPRRFIDAFSRNVLAYDPTEFENQALKFKTLEELLEPIKKYAIAKPEQLKDYQDFINETFGLLKAIYPEGSEEWKVVARRVLFFAGLKEGDEEDYTIGNTVTLHPKGIKQIAETFQEYRDKGKSKMGYRRQNSPLLAEENNLLHSEELPSETQQSQDDLWDDETFTPIRSASPGTPASSSVEAAPAVSPPAAPVAVEARPEPTRGLEVASVDDLDGKVIVRISSDGKRTVVHLTKAADLGATFMRAKTEEYDSAGNLLSSQSDQPTNLNFLRTEYLQGTHTTYSEGDYKTLETKIKTEQIVVSDIKPQFEQDPLSFIYGNAGVEWQKKGVKPRDFVPALFRAEGLEDRLAYAQQQANFMQVSNKGGPSRLLMQLARLMVERNPALLDVMKAKATDPKYYEHWVIGVTDKEVLDGFDRRTLTNQEIDNLAVKFKLEPMRFMSRLLKARPSLRNLAQRDFENAGSPAGQREEILRKTLQRLQGRAETQPRPVGVAPGSPRAINPRDRGGERNPRNLRETAPEDDIRGLETLSNVLQSILAEKKPAKKKSGASKKSSKKK